MQPSVLNAVALAETDLAPLHLLGRLKRLEQQAGRCATRMSRQRTLDIDIIAASSRVTGWQKGTNYIPKRRERLNQLILPHPEAHRRAFVLAPLVEICPSWVHPVLRRSARDLLRRLAHRPKFARKMLELNKNIWDKR